MSHKSRASKEIDFDFINIERFFDYFDMGESTDCWEWLGIRWGKNNEYGCYRKRPLTVNAHRVSYLIFVEDLKPGMVIDHMCRNKLCVNPAHLRQVTPLINTVENSDNFIAINVQKTHCVHGHEFTPENTRIYKTHRYCKTCNRLRPGRVKNE